MVVISLLGIIVCTVMRTFNEHTEYTITAAEVEKLDKEREKKAQAVRANKDVGGDEDMGLWEFIRIVISWAWDIVRNKRWRAW